MKLGTWKIRLGGILLCSSLLGGCAFFTNLFAKKQPPAPPPAEEPPPAAPRTVERMLSLEPITSNLIRLLRLPPDAQHITLPDGGIQAADKAQVIQQFQQYNFYLTTQLRLEHESSGLTTSANRGTARLTDVLQRDSVLFPGQTQGIVVEVEGGAESYDMILHVSFEDSSDPAKTLSLPFEVTYEGFFELLLEDNQVPYGQDNQGNAVLYKATYVGDNPPRLFINLESGQDTKVNQRTVKGRSSANN